MEAFWAIVGFVIGAVTVYTIISLRGRRDKELTRQLIDDAQSHKTEELAAIVEQLKTAFGSLSRDALSQNTDDFLKLAKTKFEEQSTAGTGQLESKKKLIDATLVTMNTKLTELTTLTQGIDKDRRESVGVIKTELAKTTDVTSKLRETTAKLREALASPQRRGQWGERMAEDVLRLADFVEGINYTKQAKVSSGEKPDFTFMLPKGLCLNMDVKFPLDNYLRALEADDAASERQFRSAFLRDVRQRIKDVTKRAYISPEDGTVDCVLVFIPNEQVYGYIHEHDATLLDDAMKEKVVLCSPLTLYAVLSVIRQGVDNFRLGQASQEILTLLVAFTAEWKKFCGVVDKTGKFLNRAVEEFENLQTTRTRMLDRQLDRIDDLRQAQGLVVPAESAADQLTGDVPAPAAGDH